MLAANVDPLALYGAVVASAGILLALGSLLWQMVTWQADRRTKVRVEISLGLITFGSRSQEAVFITVTNQSQHGVTIGSVGFEMQNGGGNWAVLPLAPNGSTIPGPVAARDSGTTWWLFSDLRAAHLDITKPLVARALLTGGERFLSKRKTLLKG